MGIHLYQGLVVSNLSRLLTPYDYSTTLIRRTSPHGADSLPHEPRDNTSGQIQELQACEEMRERSEDEHESRKIPCPLYVTIPPEPGNWCLTYPTQNFARSLPVSSPLRSPSDTMIVIDDCPYGDKAVVSVHVGTSLLCARDEMIRFKITCVAVYDQDAACYVGMVDTVCIADAICIRGDAWQHQPACDWMQPVQYIMGTDSVGSVCRRSGRHFFTRDSRRVVSQGDLLRSVYTYGLPGIHKLGDTLVDTVRTPVLNVDDSTTLLDALHTMAECACRSLSVRVRGLYYRLLTVNDVCTPGVTASSKLTEFFSSKNAIVASGCSLSSVLAACIEHDVHQVFVDYSTLDIVEAEQALRLYGEYCL